MHVAGSGAVFRRIFLLIAFKVNLFKVSFNNLFGLFLKRIFYKIRRKPGKDVDLEKAKTAS